MDLSTYNVPAEIEKKILTAIDLKKQLEQYEADIKAELMQVMVDHDITSIKNDRYTITRATRSTFSGNIDDMPVEFTKRVINTAKVGSYVKLYGALPKSVEQTRTEYITWRAK